MKEMVTLNGREMPVTEAAKALCQATTYSTYLMEASNLRRPVEIMARDLPTDGRRPRRFTCLTTGTELFVSAKSLADMELEDLRLTEVDK